MQGSCTVCSEGAPKYRCPSCRVRYCSVSCCKKHKEICVPDSTPPGKDDLSPASKAPEFLQGNVSDLLDGEDESDRIPENKLKLMGESKELKQLLLNPHLRRLLLTLDQSEKREQTLKEYMQEPLFAEFADRCLSVVEPDEKENRFPE